MTLWARERRYLLNNTSTQGYTLVRNWNNKNIIKTNIKSKDGEERENAQGYVTTYVYRRQDVME